RALFTDTPSKVTWEPCRVRKPDCTLKSKSIDLSVMFCELKMLQNPPSGKPSAPIVRRLKPTILTPPQLPPDIVIRFGPLRSVIWARTVDTWFAGKGAAQLTVKSCRKP